ncbi:hypothetical protein DOTSEDRAFT_23988 [Dothistroma septosporum NZE10]|uniref:PPM-type phosphatase domain-containing protein n=1 Tax=Dothistroma septosporum (strain NZE10 / CBS 128990) TaxID=675120 RepID=N1PN97_DOTSN|nr:hypothetical protein DOTSEDRAFT_23988 [Dothistroma septosporum NZE10]
MAATKIKDIGISTVVEDRPHQEDRCSICRPRALSHTDYALTLHIDCQLSAAAFGKSPEEVIQDTIRAEDDALRDLGCLSTGSTVALALLDTKKNVLTTADLGDSPILLTESSTMVGAGPRGHPDYPNRKSQMIERSATKSVELAARPRTEAAGCEEDCIYVGRGGGGPATGDLLSNVAHMVKRELKSNSRLMLATDGVGEAPRAEEAAKHALKLWGNGVKAENIAADLTSKATTMPNSDNGTVIVVVLDSQ